MVRVGDKLWIQLNKEWLQGPSKKIKALQYHPFYILEKVGDNSCKPSIPPYMCIYSIVVVENLKLYDPSMLDQEEEQVLPSIEYLALDAQEELANDTLLQKRSRTIGQGKHELWKIGLIGKLQEKVKWYSREKAEESISSPHSIKLLGRKILPKQGGIIYIISPYVQEELVEDTIFHKQSKATRQGKHDL